jgi:hypothetical protein
MTMTTPDPTYTVLNSPSVWTDQYGVDSLDTYLDYPVVQNAAQQALMAGAFEGLINADIITGTETPRFIATFLQPATLYGVNAVVAWVNGTADPDTVVKCQIAARQAQFAIDLSDQIFSEVAVDEPVVDDIPTTDYTDRTVIDTALQEIIDNAKIPTPRYSTPVEVQLPTGAEEGTFRFAPGNRGK